MADSFFGFDTSLSNLNDDEGGGEPSEEEYDALNDETFGQDSEEFDWEIEHEQLAGQLENSRRNAAFDEADSRLEASLSQLVLDETDAPHSRSLGSSVWRHDLPFTTTTPAPPLKNVCTVEELERQLRQNQAPNYSQNYFQPRFPPVILQRPPGLQAPVPLPFAPQQPMAHNMNQMNQPLNKIIGQNSQMNQMGQNPMVQNQMMNHMNPTQHMNKMGQNMNQMGQTMKQMGQNMNQMGQNMSQMSQNLNPMGQNINPMQQNMNSHGQNVNQMGQNVNQMGQNMNQMGQSVNQFMQNANQANQFQNNQMGQNMMNQMNMNMHPQNNQMMPPNQMGQNMNPMGQNINPMNQMPPNMNQMGQNMNQMGQNMNQMGQMPNGNQFMNQFHMMGQRMMAPPPGMNMPRQNFSTNVNQFNQNFRGPSMPKNEQPMNQPIMNQIKNQPLQPVKQNQVSPQNKKPIQNQNQKIKTRVYNNSNNLTSQNMVQIIQNTHPMLINSFHNASHHPMLNNRMFGNQVVHPMFRNFVNNRQSNSEDGSTDSDDYAGLMTSREKQWLINIQMLQLNTGTPYIHDFYYTVFLERQANKEKEGIKEAHKANQQNHPFYSGGVKQEEHRRERHNSHRHNSTGDDAPRTYVPTQFENSLGKLQCGSVTAPRKIIDVELPPENASGRQSRAPSVASTSEVPREMKRTKQLLLDIEALYLILLRLEELNDPLAISNALILKEREEKQKQLEAAQKEAEYDDDSNLFLKNIESVQRRKQDSPKSECIDKRQVVNLAVMQKPVPVKNLLDEDKDELLNKIFTGLFHGDRFQQILTVRKGRSLVVRFVRRVPVPHSRLRGLWARVLCFLAAACRRDDGELRALGTHFRRYIQNTTGWLAVRESCDQLSEVLHKTPYVLTASLTLTCVCALMERSIMLVNTMAATSEERQYYKFLKMLAKTLKNTNVIVARPNQPLPESKVLIHIKQLESRSPIEILQRGKSADFDLSKNDVTEQLVKHLC